jgi:hypothetical protein
MLWSWTVAIRERDPDAVILFKKKHTDTKRIRAIRQDGLNYSHQIKIHENVTGTGMRIFQMKGRHQ